MTTQEILSIQAVVSIFPDRDLDRLRELLPADSWQEERADKTVVSTGREPDFRDLIAAETIAQVMNKLVCELLKVLKK